LDVRILAVRDVVVGEEILLVKSLVQFLERLLRIDEARQPGPLDKLLFVALPAGAVNGIVIQGAGTCTNAPSSERRK
jgi:hypothetical protein